MSEYEVKAYPLDVEPNPLKLYAALSPRKNGFMLYSSGGPADIRRYSFLGGEPFFESAGGRVEKLFERLASFRCGHRHDLPPFQGGAVGFFSYDLGRQFEVLPVLARDDLKIPHCHFGWYDTIISIDHGSGRVWLVQLEGRDNKVRLRQVREDWLRRLHRPHDEIVRDDESSGRAVIESNFTREAYLKAVQRAIEYIYAGDIFQVNLSQRFTAPLLRTPWSLFNRLSRHNPSPFSAYLDLGGYSVISSSPERFISVVPADSASKSRLIETRPIKGTRPRGSGPEEDAVYSRSLLDSEKDAAELRMIVDLERNDLGRIAKSGSVKVLEDRRLEAYPTVFHTVSIVTGEVAEEHGLLDILKATFPGGSITGAPKIRAMEIIEELEPVRRGVYTGSIGYLGFSGAVDLNIAIRTLVVKDKRVYFHAGGGIVADSDPVSEYEETLVKAEALMRTLTSREQMV